MWINGIRQTIFNTNAGAIDITLNNPDICGYFVCYNSKEAAMKAAKQAGIVNYNLCQLEVTKND